MMEGRWKFQNWAAGPLLQPVAYVYNQPALISVPPHVVAKPSEVVTDRSYIKVDAQKSACSIKYQIHGLWSFNGSKDNLSEYDVMVNNITKSYLYHYIPPQFPG